MVVIEVIFLFSLIDKSLIYSLLYSSVFNVTYKMSRVGLGDYSQLEKAKKMFVSGRMI